MTKRKASLLTAAILGGIGIPIVLLKIAKDRLTSMSAVLAEQSEKLAALSDENATLTQFAVDPKDLARLQKEHDELMRLGSEVATLRRKELEKPSQPPTANADSADPPNPAELSEDLETRVVSFRADFNVDLERGESLTAGGWSVAPGKRGLFVVTPEVVKQADQTQGAQVMIKTKFLEAPEELLVDLGLEQLLVNGNESALGHALSAERTRELLSALKDVDGVAVVSSPSVITLDGRQAQVKAQDTRSIDGEIYEIGPKVDLLPTVSSDATSINLSVVAELSQLSGGNEP